MNEINWDDVEQLEFVNPNYPKIVGAYRDPDGTFMVIGRREDGNHVYYWANADGSGRYSREPLVRNRPRRLSGFVNVYREGQTISFGGVYHSACEANEACNTACANRIAMIDLSQFEVGHGLNDDAGKWDSRRRSGMMAASQVPG